MAEPAAGLAPVEEPPVEEDNDYVAEVALDDETTLAPEDETPKEEVEKEINSLEVRQHAGPGCRHDAARQPP
eukprot:scaffold63450_cov59-Phaeocystis_antarctica.AAC.3